MSAYQGYKAAVQWIAENDESAETNLEIMSLVPTVQLVADMHGKTCLQVAKDVLRRRERQCKPS